MRPGPLPPAPAAPQLPQPPSSRGPQFPRPSSSHGPPAPAVPQLPLPPLLLPLAPLWVRKPQPCQAWPRHFCGERIHSLLTVASAGVRGASSLRAMGCAGWHLLSSKGQACCTCVGPACACHWHHPGPVYHPGRVR